jgi:hypothetical protein
MERQLIDFHRAICRAGGSVVEMLVKRKLTKRGLKEVLWHLRNACDRMENFLDKSV